MRERSLKVGYKCTHSSTPYNKKTKQVPQIILSGNWLQKAGFYIGDFTKVIVADTFIQLVLKPKKGEPDNV